MKARRHWIFTVLVVGAVEFLMAVIGHRFELIQTNPLAAALISVPVTVFLLSRLVIRPAERELSEQSNQIVASVNERLALESRHRHEIEEREARYRAVVEDLTEMVVRRRATGEVTFANPAFLETFGLSLEDAIGRPFPVVPHPEDQAIVEEKVKELGKANPLVKVWHRVTTPTGIRWQTWTHRAILGLDGEVSEIQLVGSDITAMRAVQDQIAQSRAELRDLAHRLFALQEEERRAVAKEIHDGLCQSLTALSFQFAFLKQSLDLSSAALRSEVEEISALLESIISDARTLSRRLRPGILDDLGLVEAVRAAATQFSRRTGIQCEVAGFDEECPLDIAARGALYRIAEEALSNVEKHSGAKTVRVDIGVNGPRLILCVEDDGRGLPPDRAADARSIGLLGMRERAMALQGTFAIVPRENGGTRIRVEMPLTVAGEP